jgi:hypothetical protein
MGRPRATYCQCVQEDYIRRNTVIQSVPLKTGPLAGRNQEWILFPLVFG